MVRSAVSDSLHDKGRSLVLIRPMPIIRILQLWILTNGLLREVCRDDIIKLSMRQAKHPDGGILCIRQEGLGLFLEIKLPFTLIGFVTGIRLHLPIIYLPFISPYLFCYWSSINITLLCFMQSDNLTSGKYTGSVASSSRRNHSTRGRCSIFTHRRRFAQQRKA